MIIGVKKFDNTEILIETNKKLQDDISPKNIVILITSVIKDGSKFYPQMFLGKALIT